MTRTCPDCSHTYDDALCSTLCPHDQFISREDADRKDKGFKMLGKFVRSRSTGHVARVNAMNYIGMLYAEGAAHPAYDPLDCEVVESS